MSSGFSTFTFDTHNILDGSLRSVPDQSVAYSIRTEETGPGSSRERRRTILQLQGGAGAPACIDWKQKTFEISGVTRNISEVRTSRGRFKFSPSHHWSWFDCEEYKLKYGAEVEHSWTVYSYSGETLATFTSNVRHLHNKKALPVLSICPSIRDEEERRFIILVLLYSETKRHQKELRRSLGGMGDFFGNLGGD
ncbi:hypothetical protein FB45DRAFT_907074 [Roridomyces roridus]|uniref:Uncharacterized protein n=1 Tax=Roridomyces roridus TaxID=1738132 RepID=A0AAD7FQ52_9AGAR|nr:hypothetical protein FB45DRAFT_907074 [Roridomyces roridus]